MCAILNIISQLVKLWLNLLVSTIACISSSFVSHWEGSRLLKVFVFRGPRVLEIIFDSSQSCASLTLTWLLSKPSQGDEQNPRISCRDVHQDLRKTVICWDSNCAQIHSRYRVRDLSINISSNSCKIKLSELLYIHWFIYSRCRWVCFFIRFVEMCLCISVSAMDALQWMGAVRMRVW